jgi:hypothetical protein
VSTTEQMGEMEVRMASLVNPAGMVKLRDLLLLESAERMENL